MPSHTASHAKCTSVGSLSFGQFGVCSLDHSSSPAFFGRCRRQKSCKSWKRRGVASNECQMSVIWYALHVFPCIHVSSDEREPPNQRDIGSKKRDLVTATFEPVNRSQRFTVFSGCQEASRKKEEASCDLDRVILLGCWVRWLQARGSIDAHCIWLCFHGLAGPCWFSVHAASPTGATGTKTTSRGHST